MEQKYNIVIISVTPLLTEVFREILKKKNLNYPIFEANMETAAEIVQKFQQDSELHVFITRGRTYTYLSECTNAALVNVKTSYFAYASLIKQYHEQGIRKIAILGYSDQFRHNADKLNNVLDEGIDFYFYNWRDYSDDTLHDLLRQELIRLHEEGVQAFIGGRSICNAADELGYLCLENFPDTDLVEAALEEAEQIARSILAREEKNQTVSAFLKAVPETLLKINQDGWITDYNLAGEKAFGADRLSCNIKDLLPDIDLQSLSRKTGIEHDVLLNYRKKKLIADIAPIIVNNEYSGAILTARFVDEIQKIEQNIRTRLSQKGLVAKTLFSDILGSSPAIQQTISWAKRIARAEGTVLIIGETGTGKELFAQSIHNYSSRAKAPFVAINCAALSPSVLESELFGYVKGAFTGARSEGKQGIFELAHGGTIFLDEIGELPIDIQAKLLRVIQEKEIVRIGDTRVVPVDVRVTAATNRNLNTEVDLGHFRADLFYRLNVLTLQLPPLQERKEDIPFLAKHFLSLEKPPHEFTIDALHHLAEVPWPGNIRQLKNCVERASVFVDHYWISQEDLRQIFVFTSGSPQRQQLPNTAADEREKITQALRTTGGNRAQTAEMLGISTVTLWRKMKKFGLLATDTF